MIKSVDDIRRALDEIETVLDAPSSVFINNTQKLRTLIWEARETVDALDALDASEDHGGE